MYNAYQQCQYVNYELLIEYHAVDYIGKNYMSLKVFKTNRVYNLNNATMTIYYNLLSIADCDDKSSDNNNTIILQIFS